MQDKTTTNNNRKSSARVSLRLPNDVFERIERLRGDTPRGTLIIEALRIGLDRISQTDLIDANTDK